MRPAALLLALLLCPAAQAADSTPPEVLSFRLTDCEGNLLPNNATVTTTGTAHVYYTVQDSSSGLAFGRHPFQGSPDAQFQTPSSTGTVLLLHLDEAGAAPAYADSSGNGNAGGSGSHPAQVAGQTGFGNARSWSPGNLIQVNASASLNSTTNFLTLQAWINPGSLASPLPILEWSNGADHGVRFWVGVPGGANSGELYANYRSTLNANQVLQSAAGAVQAGQWQLVTAIFGTDGVARLYVNDAQVASQSFGFNNLPLQTSYNLFVGRSPSLGASFNGAIDEVRVLSRSLSELQVANAFHSGLFDDSESGSGGPFARTYLSNAAGSDDFIPATPAQGTNAVVTVFVSSVALKAGTNNVLRLSLRDRTGETASTGNGVVSSISVPDAPTGLAGTALGPTSIRWDWSKPSRICLLGASQPGRYNLYAGDGTTLVLGNQPGLNVTEGGLGVNSLTTRRVSAFDDYGESALSGAVGAYTLAQPPVGIGVASLSTGSLVVSWGANGNPAYTRYEVTLWSAGFGSVLSTPFPVSADLTAVSAGLSSLSPQTTYYVRVRAFNGRSSDNSGSEFTSYISTVVPTLPAPPGTLSADVLGVSSVAWRWTPAPTALSYRLENDSGGVLTVTASTGHVVTGLTPNLRVGARLRVDNQSGQGEFGPLVFTHTDANPPAATALVGVTTGSATIQWQANGNPGATTYEAFLATSANFGGTVRSQGTTALGAAFDGLLPATTYYLRVRSLSGASRPSAFDATVQARTSVLSPVSSGATPPTPYEPQAGSVAIYHFDQSSGTTAIDSSGAGNHLTLACTFVGCSSPTFTAGMTGMGNAVSFAGVQNTLCRADHGASLNTSGALTVEAWVNPHASQVSGAGLVAKGDGGDESFALVLEGGRYKFFVRDAGGAVYQAVSTQAFKANLWTHVVGVFSPGAQVGVYVDGVLSSSTTVAPAARRTNAHQLTVGARQSGAAAYDLPFRGLLDEVHVLTTALSPAQIAANYLAGFPGGLSLPVPNEDTRLRIPPIAFGGDAVVFTSSDPISSPIRVLPQVVSDALASPPPGHTLVPGSLVEIVPTRGGIPITDELPAAVEVTLSYPDADGNTLIDGVSPPLSAENASLWRLNSSVVSWQQLPSSVDLSAREVTGQTTRFSVFALFAPNTLQPDTDDVVVYPVPWRPGSSGSFGDASFAGRSGLAFGNLPASGSIRILTLSGEKVVDLRFEAANVGTLIWNGLNGAGRPVASGVYFAYVRSDSGSSTVRKFAIER